MTEEEVKTEEEAAEEKAAEEKAAEEKAAADKESELSPLEKREKELVEQEKAEKERSAEEDDTKIEDVDLDALKEKFPIIGKLGLKADSIVELLEDALGKYAGGLEDFQRDSGIVKDLKEAGYDTPSKLKDFITALKSGEIKKPETKEAEPDKADDGFAAHRSSKFLEHVVSNPEMYQGKDEDGEPIPLTEEQQKKTAKSLSDFGNLIFPAELGEAIFGAFGRIRQLDENQQWFQYQRKSKETIEDDLRDKIMEHAEKVPHVYQHADQKARKEGRNIWEAYYETYVGLTKQDEIAQKKADRQAEERLAEEKKKKDAKLETTKKRVVSSSDKELKVGSAEWVRAREARIRRMEEEGEE